MRVLPLITLVLAPLAAGPALPRGPPSGPRSRVPGAAANEPPVLRPDDLARAAAQAPAAAAALYRDLARADPKAEPSYEETALRKIDKFLADGAAGPPALD